MSDIRRDLSEFGEAMAHLALCDGDRILAGSRPQWVFRECHRILKPGGFLFAFGAPSRFHRIAAAIEDSISIGLFEMRDAITWTHDGTPHPDTGLRQHATLISIAQKAREGTFVDNWCRHGVGLIDTRNTWCGKFPANVMEGAGSSRTEIARHLLRVFGRSGHVVLDPFMVGDDFQSAALQEGAVFIASSPAQAVRAA